MKREDFPMLKQDIVYFDNGATTFKPYCVIEAIKKYYTEYTANCHRGDYKLSLKVDNEYEHVRELVKEFINAKRSEEIIFTSGATDGLNRIVFGFFKYYLNQDDEILIAKSEHASNILPWMELSRTKKVIVKYIPLDEDYKITLKSVISSITNKTKVISLAHITNVIGDIRPLKEIIDYAHKLGIIVVVDGAQAIGHMKVDVNELGVDFYVFSGHKMYGPTGVGVLYGKYNLLDKIEPLCYGGGMNATFDSTGKVQYKELPYALEAGTPNIAGVIGLGAAVRYLNDIGMNKIHEYEINLRKYLINKLSSLSNVDIYNKNSEAGIVAFNVQDVFSQDTAIYLDKHNIYVRAGNHCAKILKEELGVKNTCRIGLAFYNNYEDVDKLIKALSNENLSRDIIF